MALYDAFISYSHAKDKPIAAALQSAVQKLGKPWYRRRALRVFRDDTSLSATPHLWPSIEQALSQSRFLILLASPEAAASRWVGKEIEYWLAHKSPQTLLIALTDGALAWDEAAGDFGPSPEAPLPAPLKGAFAAEPKWVDLTAYRGGAPRRDAKFTELAADFAAAIRGIPKEDLLSQELRQQRRALTLAWSAAGSLLVLAGLAGWQWQTASEQRARAETALGAARQTAETLVFDLARDMRTRPGMPAELVDDILARVQTLQQQLAATGSTVELYRLEAASLYMRSQSLEAKGDIPAATEAVRRALQILEALATKHPDQALVQRDLAVSLNQLADLLRRDERWSEVLALHRRALAIIERLAAADPGNVNLQRDAWLTGNKIAEVLTITGAYEEALAGYRKGLATGQALLAKDPDNPALLSDLAYSYSRVGITDNAMGRYAEALAAHREALALRERAAARANDTSRQRDVFVSLHRIGEVLANLGQHTEAVESFRKAVAIMEPLAASDLHNVGWQTDLIGIYDALAQALVKSGQTTQALDVYVRAVAGRERRAALAPNDPAWQADLASNLLLVGSAFLAAGQSEQAAGFYRQAIQSFERLVAAQPDIAARGRQLAAVHLALGDLYAQRRQWTQARDSYEQCRKLREVLLARNTGDVSAQRDLAAVIERSGVASGNLEDLPAALASYRAALALRARAMAAEPGNVAFQREYVLTLSMAADALYRMDRKAEARDDFRKAFAIVEAYAAASPDNAALQLDLAIGLYQLAYYLDEDPAPRRDRARDVIERLDRAGKLTAAQKSFIAGLEQLLLDKPNG